MNKKNLPKKFALNKRTVADLTRYEQSRVIAGEGEDRCAMQECYFSGSAVWRGSSQFFFDTQTQPLPNDPRYWPCYMPITTDTR